MPESTRELALQILSRVNTGRGRARDILNRTIQDQNLIEPDRSFITELVYGTIRWRGNLDWIIFFILKPFPQKLYRLKITKIFF